MFASYLNLPQHVSILLSHGAEIDSVDERGMSALCFALMSSHAEVARTLLAAGAKFTQTNKEVITPLFIAARNGSLEIVELLLSCAAQTGQLKELLSTMMALPPSDDPNILPGLPHFLYFLDDSSPCM